MEKGFVDSLLDTIERGFHGSVHVRSKDAYTLGIPDILAWIPAGPVGNPMDIGSTFRHWPWSLAIEAKEISPLMEDPMHKGHRTGQMLHHPFTGPQMSMLRKLRDAGVDAFGLIRVAKDTALRVEPEDLPIKTGNFTYEELFACGQLIKRIQSRWRFWEPEGYTVG